MNTARLRYRYAEPYAGWGSLPAAGAVSVSRTSQTTVSLKQTCAKAGMPLLTLAAARSGKRSPRTGTHSTQLDRGMAGELSNDHAVPHCGCAIRYHGE